jgi:heat shock protein HslJ
MMRRSPTRSAALAALVLVVVAACGGSSATPTPVVTAGPTPAASEPGAASPGAAPGDPIAEEEGLEGREWALIGISQGGGPLVPVAKSLRATLRLQDGAATGESGCNTFAGTYSLDGPQLLFGEDFVLTEKACEQRAMVLESDYIALLRNVARFGGQPTGMVFVDPAGVPLLAYVPVPTGPIEGTWAITTYQDAGGAQVAPIEGSSPSLSFASGGAVTLSDGCGDVAGTWEAAGERLSVTLPEVDTSMCSDDAATAQAQALVAATGSSAFWTATPTGLVLRGENGFLTIAADRVGEAPGSPGPSGEASASSSGSPAPPASGSPTAS